MKTLHIHIGTPKTGSTSIQRFCLENAEVLEKKGFCYPVFDYHYPRCSNSRAHFLLGMIWDKDGKRDYAQENKNFKEGMQMIHELFQTYDNILLSDESIWRGMDSERKSFWKDMMQEAEKGGFSLHIIVYFRRQDQLYTSLWNQQVKKKRSESTFEQFVKNTDQSVRLDYYDKLERMAETVGKENITVRRFDKSDFKGGSIYSDFLFTVGLSLTDEYDVGQSVRNVGLYGNTHEMKRVLNAMPFMKDNESQNFIVERLQECSEISGREYPCTMYSKEEIDDFLSKYEDGNRKIAEEYLHEDGTQLFEEEKEEVQKWEKDNPYMMDDAIRFTGVMGIYLFRENQELKNELVNLKTSVDHMRHPLKTLFLKLRQSIQRDV